jgi:hypothetical protein
MHLRHALTLHPFSLVEHQDPLGRYDLCGARGLLDVLLITSACALAKLSCSRSILVAASRSPEWRGRI